MLWTASPALAKDAPEARTHALVAAMQKHAAAADTQGVAGREREIDDLFDFDRLSQDPMVPHRKALTAAQRSEFTGLFRRLIRQRTLAAGSAFNEGELHYGAAQQTPKRARVDVHVTEPAKDVDLHVTFVWEDTGSAWRVVDVELDGASVVRDYQSQFGRILRKDGAAGLIAKIRRRLDEGDAKP
jgi:phospholipid transport system substrate-binding protein